ncbi:MAG: hypothetical protein KDD53_02380 [Bdellovibrionales bacterium]|nr:hypothetical protein [Bdellovibrionales bacterium]
MSFFSDGDEIQFFKWIDSIKGVVKYEGICNELHITVRARLSDKSKHELWGLFKRYRVPTKQLKDLNLLPSYWKSKSEFGMG